MLVLAIAVGVLRFLHIEGHFQLPKDFSTLPFDALCGGIALLFFVIGMRELIRRRGYRVDPLRQTFQTMKRGVFGTRYGEAIPFSQLKHVQIDRAVRGTHNNKRTYFSVHLHLESNGQHRVFSSDRYPPARNCGEKLAKLAHVDLHDASEGGATQIRQPQELDDTVRDKLRKEFSERSQPTAPAHMHANIQRDIETLTIEIPPFDIASLGPMQKALWIMFVIFGGWAAVALYFKTYMFALFGVFVFGVLLYLVVRSESITLTHDTLVVRDGAFLLKRTRRIQLSELEELHMHNVTESESEDSDKLLEQGEVTKEMHRALEAFTALGSSMVARSDRQSIRFGRILSHAELDYVLYELESRIVR